jgi:hypothetical protein
MGMEIVVVERLFETPVDPAELTARAAAGQWCFEVRNVRYLTGYVSGDGRRMVCIFEAPDAESVRTANRQANLPFERVWTATVDQAAKVAETAEI